MTTRLLTLRDVMRITALSRSAVYALMAEFRFPKPILLGSRAVRWVEQEVLDAGRVHDGRREDGPSAVPFFKDIGARLVLILAVGNVEWVRVPRRVAGSRTWYEVVGQPA